MSKTPQHQSALDLAAKGFRVFPLSQGTKIPLADMAWKEVATSDPKQIEDWWSENEFYNVGIATGKGLVVVDADCTKGKPGLETLEYMDMLDLPQSFRVKTASGGAHVYLKTDHPHRQRIDNIPEYPGIDIKCEGNYVVGPGSFIGSDGYEVTSEAPIEKLPTWFNDHLKKHAKIHRERNVDAIGSWDQPANVERAKKYLLTSAPEAIEGAGGDQITYSVACACRDYGLSQQVVLDLMLDHWNEQKASPPWDPESLQDKVRNAYNYGQNQPGIRQSAGAEFDDVDIEVGEPPEEVKTTGLLKLLSPSQMLEMPEPTWMIDGIMQERSSVLMFGKSNTFKSFLAIDMACSVATGREWHGRKVKKHKVLYVATEGANGVGRIRIPEWFRYHDVPFDDSTDIFLYPSEISLDNEKNVGLLLKTANAMGIELIVLDIFAGTMDGTETEDTTARAWVRGVNRIIQKAQAGVLVVAHTGWADQTRARMHTHFWGSFDSRLRVEGDKDKRTSVLAIDRHKDADSTGKWGFKLDTAGKSLVPVLEDTVATEDTSSWPIPQKVAMQCLRELVEVQGSVETFKGAPNAPGVLLSDWQTSCMAAGITNSEDSKTKSRIFRRVKTELIERGAIKSLLNMVWDMDDVAKALPPPVPEVPD
jgi:hypothetical protein